MVKLIFTLVLMASMYVFAQTADTKKSHNMALKMEMINKVHDMKRDFNEQSRQQHLQFVQSAQKGNGKAFRQQMKANRQAFKDQIKKVRLSYKNQFKANRDAARATRGAKRKTAPVATAVSGAKT